MSDLYNDEEVKNVSCDKDMIANRYRIERKIGGGGFSNVYLVTDIHIGMRYAAKHIKDAYVSKKELGWLRMLSHPGIPKLHDIIWVLDGVYIIMEYKCGQSLGEILKVKGSLPVARVNEIADDLLQILSYLHSFEHPIAYGDIKPENIIVEENGKVSLIDFGSAVMAYGRCENIYATSGYASPEQLDGRICLQSDIYSFGKLIQTLLTGCRPEFVMNYDEKEFLRRFGIEDKMAGFIVKCCEVEAQNRFINAGQCYLAFMELKKRKKKKKKRYFLLVLFRLVTMLWFIMIMLSIFNGCFEWNNYLIPGMLSLFAVTLLYDLYLAKTNITVLECEFSVCLSKTANLMQEISQNNNS